MAGSFQRKIENHGYRNNWLGLVIGCQRMSLNVIGCHWMSMDVIEYHWMSLDVNG
jgi:hypothetical protein